MKIVNIIAIAKMEKPFELEELYNKLNNTEMASTWLKMRLQPENYYIAFYRSGKFLITGIKDIKMVDTICSRVINY
jgi:transcription initiation factor TFIID TATA-box-binding protein